MTLRVTLEIVPFGEESEKRKIRVFNISNLGRGAEVGDSLYGVEVDEYKTHEYNFIVTHKRSEGAEVLVKKVLEAYVDT